MPRPEYDRSKVLAWYASLKNVLKEANIDMDKPTDLARVKVFYFDEAKDTKDPGNPGLYDDEKCPAFVSKKFDKDKKMVGYTQPKPHLPNQQVQENLDYLLKNNKDANATYINSITDLKNAYLSKNEQRIEEAKRAVDEAKAGLKSTFDEFRVEGKRAFKDYYQWIYANQKKFDPKTDYDQIEELYHSAMEGRLYVHPLNENPEDRWQLVVTGNGGTSQISKTGAMKGESGVDVNSVLDAINTLKKGTKPSPNIASLCDIIKPLLPEYEKQNGVIGSKTDASMKSIGNPPAEVPKPGVGSWFKWFFSFGRVRTDYDNYDRYVESLNVYNAQKSLVRDGNLDIYNKTLDFMNKYNKELGIKTPEGTLNPGAVEENRMRMHYSEFVMGEEKPEKEIFCDGTNMVMIRHAQIVEKELSDKPENIKPDGSFDLEKGQAYWDEKGELVAPITKEDREKPLRLLEEAETNYRLRKEEKKELSDRVNEVKQTFLDVETGDIQDEMILNKNANKKIETLKDKIDFDETKLLLKGLTRQEKEEVITRWTSASVDERIKKIGKAFGASDKDAWKIGIRVFSTCVTSNQEYNADGSERDYSKLRTDREIVSDLDKLLEVADNPESKILHKDLIDNLQSLMKNTKEIPSDMLYDSIACILSTQAAFDGRKEAKELTTGLFMCAHLAYRTAADFNPNPIDINPDYKVEGEQNRTLSSQEERTELFQLGKECYEIERIALDNKRSVEELKRVKQLKSDKVFGVEVEDLSLTRDQNLDLAKEPGLYK
ncbi:MAG: hypothetical protein Q4E99_00890 [Bacillota bacterium]|nr:hypothetical protein [Bacillota bacterium]